MVLQDRASAGRELAGWLEKYREEDALILALPRGGIVVAYEIANALHLPLDVLIVRKIGAPGNPEWAIGAVAEMGQVQFDRQVIDSLGIPNSYLELETRRQREEIARRRQMYRQGRSLPDVTDRTVIVVDDGIATGYTVLAAVRALKAERPAGLVVAAPVASPTAVEQLRREADEVVVLEVLLFFAAVSQFYNDFKQVSDEEVREYLAKLNPAHVSSA
jgi:putative phosphoribosyl transferase